MDLAGIASWEWASIAIPGEAEDSADIVVFVGDTELGRAVPSHKGPRPNDILNSEFVPSGNLCRRLRVSYDRNRAFELTSLLGWASEIYQALDGRIGAEYSAMVRRRRMLFNA